MSYFIPLCTRLILPSRQADHPIAALSLAGFQNLERREDAHQEDLEGREDGRIFLGSAARQDIVTMRLLPCAARPAMAWRMPRMSRSPTGPAPMTTSGFPVSRTVYR